MKLLFAPRRAMRLSLLLSIALLAGGCATIAPTVTSRSVSCATLIPSKWQEGVEGVDWPGEAATAADVWVALDRQTGKLDQANDRTVDALSIITRCEERDAAAVKRSTKGFWGRLFD